MSRSEIERFGFRLPSQEEIDSLYLHIWILVMAAIMLAFAIGICVAMVRTFTS
jgi:type III secretory pathway component EscS